ncbi:hypothetical protein HTVC304P_gp5 [Pelagibacter phage HTVC304P]|jgi:hypothetical protein|nr:hypothetical protein HTVC304P_gp5 [Pelagibacter phage HTVC304P]
MIGLGCQLIEGELEEIKINALGYTENGRAILDSQEHIFTEAFAEMEVLSAEDKLAKLQQKYFNK